jgi:diguanylate cyclase (GGDEF)-like protein
MVRGDGRDLWVETIASPTVYDGRPAVQVLCWDITDRVLEHQRLTHAASHDRLTGLPNRTVLEKRWTALQAGWTSADRRPAVLFGDLDGFKAVNDAHGHAVGDAVLRAVAARLSAVLRSEDVLGRYGGDEFVVLVEAAGPELTRQLTDRLTGALHEPVHVLDRVVQVGMSVGLAVPATADEPLEALLHRADEAMYDSKRRARRGSATARSVP